MPRSDLLLVGRWPPPIGGVTMHVQRLEAALRRAGRQPSTVDVRRTGVFAVLTAIVRHRVCHLHVSHPAVQCALVLWARLVATRCVVTLHGDVDRFRGWRRAMTRIALTACEQPVVLNDGSLQRVSTWNDRVVMLSAYLPADGDESLPVPLADALRAHRARWRPAGPLVITSAFDLAFDAGGRETYGIFALVDWCAGRGIGLVVCDPSGRYHAEAVRRLGGVPDHVLFLRGPHSFVAALAEADVYVRNTTTDGDSLSVHEALHAGCPVWATAVVRRPAGTHTFTRLDEVDPARPIAPGWQPPPCLDPLLAIYDRRLTD